MIHPIFEKTRDYLYPYVRHTAHLLRFWLAMVHSKRLKKVCFVGITGSAGKTTVKDLSANILTSSGECFSTPRSMNYPDGIAKIMLRMSPTLKYGVLEVSGGNPGGLDRPLRLFTPGIAVLTLVARDHFKAHKSLEAIAKEKSKLISALPANGIAVLNIDDPRVRSIGRSCNRQVIWVGESEGATLKLISARSKWPESLTLKVEYQGEIYEAKTSFHGKHLALSVLSALGVGLAAGIPLQKAISAAAEVKPPEGRMEIVSIERGVTFLRDDWKAPHWSFSAPLEFMAEAEAQRKILVIGTLSDYSLSASKLYPKVARQALEVGDIVIFVGPHAPRAAKAKRDPVTENLRTFSEIRDAAVFLNSILEPGDLVLLKGSNKADHLVRLMYHWQSPVSCWLSQCGIQDFCGNCSRLYRPVPTEAGSSAQTATTPGLTPIPLTGNDPERTVLVGLGNPGSKYENTPHNAGYRVLDRIAARANASWVSYPEGMGCDVDIAGETVSLFKPAGKINNSGPSTLRFLSRNGVGINNCLVVHDEMDLSLGRAKLKEGGGDAGHRGLKSIITALGSHDFKRLRIGVRRADGTKATSTSVLQPFGASDEQALESGIDRAMGLLLDELKNSNVPGSNIAYSDQKTNNAEKSNLHEQ